MNILKTILCLPFTTKIPERITIIPHATGNGFDIPFSYGTINVPDTPGGYCISTGCGSGKTESIKSLIRQCWDQGILYCVDTRSECTKMHQWVIDNLIGEKLHGETLKSDDVLMIHSDADFEKLKEYKANPEKIVSIKILIITHVRFLTDLINYFLIYDPKTLNPVIPAFDGDFKMLMSQDNLRKYILFDETPLFLRPFISFSRGLLAAFSEKAKSGKYQCKSPADMKDIYDEFIKGGSLDFYKGTDRVSQIKRDVVLGLIPKYYPEWMGAKKKDCNIHFYPSGLIGANMKSHVIIYEGVGDVLFGTSSCFKLLDVSPKYNCHVDFRKFDFSLKRKQKPDDVIWYAFVKSIATRCRSSTRKTLIVVWKDYKDDDEKRLLNETDKSEWTNKLKEALVKEGVPDSNFTVTYYGASDTKSTNAFRDYRNIVLGGSWDFPPSSTVERFRKAYRSKTNEEEYKLWYMVQLISRIGIRNRDGQDYVVYYSSDYSKDFIGLLNNYLNKNKITIKSGKITFDPAWMTRVKSIKGSNSYIDKIGKLINYNPDLEKALETNDKTFRMDISLNDIWKIIPMGGKKQKSAYNRLIRFMKDKLEITLNIPDNRNLKTPKP